MRLRGALGQGAPGFGTAAVVDDDRAQLPEDGLEQREALQVVAGDKGEIVELGINAEAVAL